MGMKLRDRLERSVQAVDKGFGLVEILISMFLLALLAVAFLPLLIDALRVSITNAKVATANQILSEQLDAIALLPRTCAAYNAFESATLPAVADERGTTYQASRDVVGCTPAAYPAAVTITLTVTVVGEPEIRARAVTRAVVESAN